MGTEKSASQCKWLITTQGTLMHLSLCTQSDASQSSVGMTDTVAKTLSTIIEKSWQSGQVQGNWLLPIVAIFKKVRKGGPGPNYGLPAPEGSP